jgi:Type IV secretion-system coupling protein DNA-binding domain
MLGENNILYLGRTSWREPRLFGIPNEDRRAHIYMLGKTGTGKSTLMEFMLRQDVARGRGLALLDPHGDLVNRVEQWIPSDRRADVVYLNVPDIYASDSLNPLESVPVMQRPVVAAGIVSALKKVFADSWGVRMEYVLKNALLLLLDQPTATIADIPRLLTNDDFRRTAARRATHPPVGEFWTREFEMYPAGRSRAEVVSPILNKIGPFLTDPFLHRIVAAPKSTFQPRALMDNGKILLVNLAKGKIGEGPSALFGSLLLSVLALAALGRADAPLKERRDFFVYVDEFQTFTTTAVAEMLAELRKYGVGLILANQFLDQVDPAIRNAILGNAGTLIAFRVGAVDANLIAREFSPEIGRDDLLGLPNRNFCIRMLARGEAVRPFTARTVEIAPPVREPAESRGADAPA